MSKAESAEAALHSRFSLRDRFASSLGVGPQRKQEIYIDLSKSATLLDPAYWTQILFAAGIATLGLILNSPEVIIGAMLISPLMGPILAAGLSLAAGDIILGLRAVVSLALSCLVAVAFAVFLVTLLPFKEMTSEIAARTQPNTLDLVVALFSGAIGSIATCKEVKGIVTSIPGVAIAVALMPPLCVTGYGVGIALSIAGTEGMRIARGGGLLFLTNLVAITFTAMIVFLALHIDTRGVREGVEQWRSKDKETEWVRSVFGHFPLSERARKIGSLPGRFLMILIPILILLIPLNESFSRLKQEIAHQQWENNIRQSATELWQQNFARMPTGEPRSYIDQLSVTEQEGKLGLYLRVFTSKPYTNSEKAEYTRLISARLARPAQAVALQLVEIPTASAEIAAKARDEKPVEAPPTIAQLQTSFLKAVEAEFEQVRLPPSALLISYRVTTGPAEPMAVEISYLGDHDMAPDAQSLIIADIRSRFDFPAAVVRFDRIPTLFAQLNFDRKKSDLPDAEKSSLERLGNLLINHPKLKVEIIGNAEKAEGGAIADERAKAVQEFLASSFGIAPDRTTVIMGSDSTRTVAIMLRIADESH